LSVNKGYPSDCAPSERLEFREIANAEHAKSFGVTELERRKAFSLPLARKTV